MRANSIRGAWQRLWQEAPPTLACEFTPQSLAVARWTSGSPRPDRLAIRELPADSLRAQPIRENLANAGAVATLVASALEEAQSVNSAKKRREIALLLPDMSARVMALTFDSVPDQSDEVLALLKFRLKKTVPFDIEDAAISWLASGKDIVVGVTPRAIVRQYELIFEHLGYLPGQVTVSTLAGMHLAVGSGEAGAGTMLIRQCGPTITIALSSAGQLRMMRTAEALGALNELFHDIYSSAVFYQDTYGGKVDRIFHTGFSDELAAPLWAELETELGVRPRPVAIPGPPQGAESLYLGIFGMLADQARTS